MKVSRLAVQNVRVHSLKALEIESGTTLISGPNGCGKTSLIEALYLALRGKSFRGGDDAICSYNTNFYQIDVQTDEWNYRVSYRNDTKSKRKSFIVNNKKYGRLPYALKYPIVLFEPDDLRIISGSPVRRRRFIDTLIQQYDPQYSVELNRYNRALQQRNKMLKRPDVTRDSLFSWNILLSKYGALLIAKRMAVLQKFNKVITKVYRQIAQNKDTVAIYYSLPQTISTQKLLQQYEEKFDYDRAIGATSVGPHRHDIKFVFNGGMAADIASRGENRTIVLSLKFIEAEYIEQQSGKKPIILLDDVFGELDTNRQKALMKEFQSKQIIMTSTTDVI